MVGLAAASTAIGTSADAAMNQAVNIPAGGLTSPATNGAVNWDIDGNGSNDFALYAFGASVLLTNRDAQVAVNNSFDILKLSAGQQVGTTGDGLRFGSAGNFFTVIRANTLIGAGMDAADWSVGDTGYIGFRFDISGATHYGWASITLSSTAAQFTINGRHHQAGCPFPL